MDDLVRTGNKILNFNKINSKVNAMEQTYKLGAGIDKQAIKQFNRSAYNDFIKSGGKLDVQRSKQIFSGYSGTKINGYYSASENIIKLGKGSNLSTITEELIHFRQVQDLGGKLPPNMRNLLEMDATKKLLNFGFEPLD